MFMIIFKDDRFAMFRMAEKEKNMKYILLNSRKKQQTTCCNNNKTGLTQ